MTYSFLVLLVLLQAKHFVFDWWLQSLRQITGKGIYLNPWGLSHSMLHGIWTFILFTLVTGEAHLGVALLAGVVDFLVHYHVDWSKQNLLKVFEIQPDSKMFWFLIGLDQLLHQLTYIYIVGVFL